MYNIFLSNVLFPLYPMVAKAFVQIHSSTTVKMSSLNIIFQYGKIHSFTQVKVTSLNINFEDGKMDWLNGWNMILLVTSRLRLPDLPLSRCFLVKKTSILRLFSCFNFFSSIHVADSTWSHGG